NGLGRPAGASVRPTGPADEGERPERRELRLLPEGLPIRHAAPWRLGLRPRPIRPETARPAEHPGGHPLPSGPHAAHSLVGTATTKQVFCSRLVDACFDSERAGRMKEFKVFVTDKPGELARVTEALSGAAVNIRAIASEAKHDNSILRVVTSDGRPMAHSRAPGIALRGGH